MNNVIEFKPKRNPLDEQGVAGGVVGHFMYEYGTKKVAEILLNTLNPLQREEVLKEAMQ